MSTAAAPPDEELPEGAGEATLQALLSFGQIAWEESRAPLGESVGSPQVRWEIYSTWKLLLCLHHAEYEASQCRRSWTRPAWRTEAQALQHVFLESRSLRRLGAVLRWLRWAHRWGPAGRRAAEEATGADDEAGEDAACLKAPACYESTRRALQRDLQLQELLPRPLEGPPVLHPDGPLQQRGRFRVEDLEDERRLLLHLWIHLRRGDLRGALRLCAEAGQPWRTALLQGMLPFACGEDETVGYDSPHEEGDAAALSLKERQPDWTEVGVLDTDSPNNGNEWRRVWKEQCWDAADRGLRLGGTAMDVHELAMYGFCSGNQEALAAVCGSSWGDCVFAELHCLKEWLAERLLSEGRHEFCADADAFLGEGDAGLLDPAETPAGRARRAAKLHGRLGGALPPGWARAVARLEEVVAHEVGQLLERLRSEGAPPQVRGEALEPMARLQAELIEAAWQPEGPCEAALARLRGWLADGLGGGPCPLLVKQFACHFAIWQKELAAAAPGPPLRIDDIVEGHVRELVAVAAGAGLQNPLEGNQVELIAEHTAALSQERRLDAFASLMLAACAWKGRAPSGPQGDELPAIRQGLLTQCLRAFWARFPQEAFALLAILARKVLRVGEGLDEEVSIPDVGPVGAAAVCPSEISLVLHCLTVSWLLLCDQAAEPAVVQAALSGLRLVLGAGPLEEAEARGLLASAEGFGRLALERVVLPLLVDSLLVLAAAAPEGAVEVLPALQESGLWCDARGCGARCFETLAELEWYVGLRQKHRDWSAAQAAARAMRGEAGPRLEGYGLDLRLAARATAEDLAEAEQVCGVARASLLDLALPRLAQDQPLLRQLSDTHTLLPEQQWEGLRRAIASQVLFLLLSVFEAEGDFDGAMNDLAVAVAQSPWVLQLLQPQQIRAFLRRFALLPSGDTARVGAAL